MCAVALHIVLKDISESVNNVAPDFSVCEKQPLITLLPVPKIEEGEEKKSHINCCQISYEQSSDYWLATRDTAFHEKFFMFF